MQIIEYLSETKLYGSNLGISIFFYVFLIAIIILCLGVSHMRRPLVVLSYIITIINLLFFLCFYDLDMYRKLPLMQGAPVKEVFGCGVITSVVNFICIVTIFTLIVVIRRLRSDYRYSL